MSHIGTTEHIRNGITFPEFALRCACMFLRDTSVVKGGPRGVNIPKFETTAYHRNELMQAKATRKMLKGLSSRARLKWAAREAGKAFRAEQSEYEKSVERIRKLRSKYVNMLTKTKAWEPPAQHIRLKEIMLEQIQKDMKDDLNAGDPPKQSTAKQFLSWEMAKLKRDIVYHSKELKMERSVTADTNQWIGDLTKSLVVFQKNGRGASAH